MWQANRIDHYSKLGRQLNRLSAYAVTRRDVLLVFRKSTTGQTVTLPSGTIPGHGGDGALHVAFAIGKDELDRWEAHLASRGVANFVQEVGELAETEGHHPDISFGVCFSRHFGPGPRM